MKQKKDYTVEAIKKTLSDAGAVIPQTYDDLIGVYNEIVSGEIEAHFINDDNTFTILAFEDNKKLGRMLYDCKRFSLYGHGVKIKIVDNDIECALIQTGPILWPKKNIVTLGVPLSQFLKAVFPEEKASLMYLGYAQ